MRLAHLAGHEAPLAVGAGERVAPFAGPEGDLVEVEVEGIGLLANPVAAPG
jgi:hypothetical protein